MVFIEKLKSDELKLKQQEKKNNMAGIYMIG